jgi:glycerate 2-kinase
MTPDKTLLREIFLTALRSVDVHFTVTRHITATPTTLTIGPYTTPISQIENIAIIAIGKAAAPMAEAAQAALTNLPQDTLIIAPTPPTNPPPNTTYYPGPHPTPNEHSLTAATAVLHRLHSVTPRTLVLFLISGGASAMLEQPLDPTITLAELADFHRALVASGLPIAEMNVLRKHLSAVKGGRLALAASNALAQVTLIVSDVPTATPDTVASGPSIPDPSTTADCLRILTTLPPNALPPSIQSFLLSPTLPETPKPTHPAFARSHWQQILSSDDLAQAAAHAATAAGLTPVIDNTCDDWDYRRAALYLLNRATQLPYEAEATSPKRTCLISTGEVSVTLDRPPGTGGRNAQFALFCAAQLNESPHPITVLSAGSDGVDGNSPAAGALTDQQTYPRARTHHLNPDEALTQFNSHPLFQALHDDITTGPTGNNLRDLRLLLPNPKPPLSS